MDDRRPPPRRAFFERTGALLVLRAPHASQRVGEAVLTAPVELDHEAMELFLAMSADGAVTAFNGHVDLGTGIRTALAQIVAEELDVAFERVTVVLGHTALAPNQGATIASETLQVTAVPLMQAAALARRHLLARAAAELGAAADELRVDDGIVHLRGSDNRFVSYADLLRGERIRLVLGETVATKPVEDYTIVGQPIARVDIPAKVLGEFAYVHDMRVPGMLHGRVVRPPYAGLDGGGFVGASLLAVDEGSVAGLPGFVKLVVIGDFIGVVAEREEQAVLAAERLRLEWKPWPGLPDLNEPAAALRANPSQPRTLADRGDVDRAIADAATPMRRTYVWPYQNHGSIGPSCSVADYRDGRLTLWSGTQNPLPLRADLARLLALPEERIEIIRLEAAGCYGRNCADDVGADAALLSRAVGRPVRVQLTREQESLWEPKGAAQVMDVAGGLDAHGDVAAYDFATRYPSNGAPTLALLLTGAVTPTPAVFEMGDRTAIPPYDYDNLRVVVHDMAPIVRAAWLRGVSALPNTFAHESYIDELATEAGIDPIAYRLRYLDDPRAVDLVNAVAERGGWAPHAGPGTHGRDGDILRGRGFAYARYSHGPFPGHPAAWSAWIADVEVNTATGQVDVTRVVVGQDAGLMINPAGVRHQIHGNVIQSTSRALSEQVTFDERAVTSREWGGYPIIAFPDVPSMDVVMTSRPHEPPLGAGESTAVPSAAAIANAIFDATGVRFREVPFTPERILAGLGTPKLEAPRVDAGVRAPKPARGRLFGYAAAGAAAVTALFGAGSALLPWRPAFAPIARPDPAVFSAATIERGRVLAALGNCASCHSTADGALYAGGVAIDTPFGRVWGSNITPDPETGIGAWSYPAFERAMRGGIGRDGRHLYPAFPYTSFTRTSDADLQALYAHLMAQPAVRAETPTTDLRFPFNIRPLMVVWNALFLKAGPLAADPARSPEWNRGAYLVEALGHCGGCHTDRNALGAEREGAAHLAGGWAQGWDAPSLTAISHAPIPWSADALFSYLRDGYSALHGPAAGPMAAVVTNLAALPDSDIRAMAAYLVSFNSNPPSAAKETALAGRLQAESWATARPASQGARLYAGACAVCHEAGGPALLGVKSPLALNSNVHGPSPDNLIRVILEGIDGPLTARLGAMPAFGKSLDDQQIAELVGYVRSQFAPDKPAWGGLEASVARVRSASN